MDRPLIFGREPALVLGLFSAALQLAVAFWLPWPDTTVVIVNAAAAAGLGLVTAWATRAVDGGSSFQAAILGFAQALLTVGLTFGLDITAEHTTAIMGLLAVVTAAFVRGNVVAAAGGSMTAGRPMVRQVV
jgi:hypothetical protein